MKKRPPVPSRATSMKEACNMLLACLGYPSKPTITAAPSTIYREDVTGNLRLVKVSNKTQAATAVPSIS